jgi:hypothetical protein
VVIWSRSLKQRRADWRNDQHSTKAKARQFG